LPEPHVVLIVSTQSQELVAWQRMLRGPRCAVIAVESFEAARRILLAAPLSMLIAAARLGAFSGFHLAILARLRFGTMTTVIVGSNEPGEEVGSFATGSHYLKRPVTAAELAGLVQRIGGVPAPIRKWRRVGVNRDDVITAGHGVTGRLLNVSYAGMRLQVAAPHDEALPAVFDLAVPGSHHLVTAKCVWRRALSDGSVFGFRVMPGSALKTRSWRQLVDERGRTRPE